MKTEKWHLIPVLIAALLLISGQFVYARPDSFAPIVKTEKNKVVHISISAIVESRMTTGDPFFDQFFKNAPKQQRQSALGSGFIISADGYIVTNYHVIAKADKIEVTLVDGSKYTAEIVGKDKLSELALIKIDAKNLPTVTWGDSDAIEIGDWVLAIGNPLGQDFSVTAGIISGRGRNVFGNTAYGQFLQTDAAINFGNSGGPLFNMKSEVIGINTAIVAGGQNLGFAIPSNLAKKIIDQLKKSGKVERGWLGVGIQDVTSELAESFALPKGIKGVVLTSVEKDSPAEKAGLQRGDVIVKANGITLEKTNELQQMVAETAPNGSVKLDLFRNGKPMTKSVTVGSRPSDEAEDVDEPESKDSFGMRLVEITPDNRDNLNLKEDTGLLVYSLDETGLAWDKGIRQGDIILEANSQKLKRLIDFTKVIEEAQKGSKPIFLLVSRSGREIFIALPVK